MFFYFFLALLMITSKRKLEKKLVATMLPSFSICSLAAIIALAASQALHPQTNTFNSNFKLSAAQKELLDLSPEAASSIEVAIQFERSNWASKYSVRLDPFYAQLPKNASTAPAGSILKVEPFTNTTTYTLPPTVALSRIIYQSKTLNGSLVPVSAYILWPFVARNNARKAPLVSWGHGTSGTVPDCAPSHVRNLWYAYSGPFELALAGYAVVGSDYAGLGVSHFPNGEAIPHQYTASPASGNDLLYAAQAAHEAFPDQLTEEFVVMGHSQGGGAAWGAAQQQLHAKIPGYLGTIAASPVTDALGESKAFGQSLGLLQVGPSIHAYFPKVSMLDIVTQRGLNFLKLLSQVGGCNSAFSTMLDAAFAVEPTKPLTQDAFLNSTTASEWDKLTLAGGKDFAGPMLVIQGTNDLNVPEPFTTQAVKSTCDKYAHRGLTYVKATGVGHVPIMYALRQTWQNWLDERFSNGQVNGEKGCCETKTLGATLRPSDEYQGDLNYFLEYAVDDYEVA